MAMIVCPEPEAAEIGGGILAQGGNAADAAVATAFAQCVSNPLMCSLSGTAILLHTDTEGNPAVLNGEAEIGSGPVPAEWVRTLGDRSEAIGRYHVPSEDNQIGVTSAMVPGFVAACHDLHESLGSGRLSWRELIEPSARLAETGFRIGPNRAKAWAARLDQGGPAYPSLRDKLLRDDNARRVFLKGGEEPYEPNDILTQKDLARTLDQLASVGAADFYSGAIGQQMAADLKARGSLIRQQDLEGYKVIRQKALHGQFRGFDLCTTPPPSPGVQALEMLAIIEELGIDLAGMDQPDVIHLVAQIMRAGFSDNQNIKAVPLAEAETWAEAVRRPALIHQWADRIRAANLISGPSPARSTGTTHLVVVDDRHASVSFTHSVGTAAGSGTVTPGLGFLHNNFLGHFDPRPDLPMSIEAGRRIGSGMPTIVRQDGRLRLVIGAPGGSRIITSIFQVLLEALGRGTPIDAAVKKLRFHSEEERLIHLEPGWPKATAAALRGFGNRTQGNTYQARVQAIALDENGTATAGVDPRGGEVFATSASQKR